MIELFILSSSFFFGSFVCVLGCISFYCSTDTLIFCAQRFVWTVLVFASSCLLAVVSAAVWLLVVCAESA